MAREYFNPPPTWPVPRGWTPPPDWEPDRSWPPAAPGWQFWTNEQADHRSSSAKADTESPASSGETKSLNKLWRAPFTVVVSLIVVASITASFLVMVAMRPGVDIITQPHIETPHIETIAPTATPPDGRRVGAQSLRDLPSTVLNIGKYTPVASATRHFVIIQPDLAGSDIHTGIDERAKLTLVIPADKANDYYEGQHLSPHETNDLIDSGIK